MSGRRATDATERRFATLLAAGATYAEAAERVGMSRSWGWRKAQGFTGGAQSNVAQRRLDEAQPDPKGWAQLDTDARSALEDFGIFCEQFLLRRPVPWRRDAAMRVVEMLNDRSERSLSVINTPPGSGKTTLFTIDIPLWLICGGGLCDPRRGRALRLMLGSETLRVAIRYVRHVRRLLETPRAFYDTRAGRSAERSLSSAFGRFEPRDPEAKWAEAAFVVEQLADVDLYEKEPTVQAASYGSGFLGERVDFYSWDDLVTSKNTRNVEVAGEMASWFVAEAETRLEPGGVGLLIGQRLAPNDLYRERLDAAYTDEETGETIQTYRHLLYPAHVDASCDGEHRQWDGKDDGCLLDAVRLPWAELRKREQDDPSYLTTYQQRDADPASMLCDATWLEGGVDRDGAEVPGCYDRDRGLREWPRNVGRLFDFVTVDPAGGAGNWAILWWSYSPVTKFRYLIDGIVAPLKAGEVLDFDQNEHRLVGVFQEWASRSRDMGHPIRMWIIEGNSSHQLLLQYEHFRSWRNMNGTQTIVHQTGKDKHDPPTSVETLLRPLFRQGLVRLPRRDGDLDALNLVRKFKAEFTAYPHSKSSDIVMSTWVGERHIRAIEDLDKRRSQIDLGKPLPGYLRKRQREIDRVTGLEVDDAPALIRSTTVFGGG